MRKYNIPLKDVKEVKQEIVECSSSGGGSSSGEYYLFDKDLIGTYFPEIGNNYLMIYMFCTTIKTIIKVDGEGENRLIASSGIIVDYSTITNNIKVVALKFDKCYDNGFLNTLKESLERLDLNIANFDKAFPRITEEEFYDLNKWSLEDYK